MSTVNEILTFNINNVTYGFSIDDIDGVSTSDNIEKIESNNNALIGSVVYRKDIIKAISISQVLFNKYEYNKIIKYIVLRDYNRALIVDKIDKIFYISENDIVVDNNTIIKNDIDIIDKFVKKDNNIIGVLNRNKLISYIENRLNNKE